MRVHDPQFVARSGIEPTVSDGPETVMLEGSEFNSIVATVPCEII